MSLERVTRELFPEEDITTEKILSELLSNKNINLKTHIISPIEFAILEAYITQIKIEMLFAKKHGYKQTTAFLEDFILRLKEFMVSWKRMSREEVISALAEIRKEKTGRTFSEKLLGLGKSKEE